MAQADLSRRNFLTIAGGLGAAAVCGHAIGRACGADVAPEVNTMRGPLSCDLLGVTLMHEHLLYRQTPERLRTVALDYAVKLVRAAEQAGVQTMVDLSPTRDIALYSQIAQQVKMNLVASTGSYLHGYMPKWLQEASEDQMVERMVREITEGIDGTPIRAGIIKVATSTAVFTDWEKTALRAAARVNRQLGTPIGVHSVFAPRAQFDLLVGAGADPASCFFSHVEAEFGWEGRNLQEELDYLTAIAKEGGYLLFNNFGFPFDTPWPDLVHLIHNLCDRGHADRIFISVDCNWHWNGDEIVHQNAEKHPDTQRRTYAYMLTDAVPALHAAGISAAETRTFLVDNPRQFFSHALGQRSK